MTFVAQRYTERGIEETLLVSLPSNELLPKLSEGNSMMVGVQVDALTLSATCATVLASVIITLEYGVPPSDVWLGLTQYLLLLGYTTLPVCGLLANAFMRAFNLSNQKLSSLRIMSREKAGYANTGTVHMRLDANQAVATALAKVLALISQNPLIYATVICAAMIACIWLPSRVTHVPYGIKFNRGLQCKWGELLETRSMQVEGNQQPSTVNGELLTVKVQRLAGEEPTNKPATSAPRESDDIVHARRNTGSHVNGLKFNAATLIKSRYVPGSDIATTSPQTASNKVAVKYITQSSMGALTAYPTLAVASSETLFWLNARKPYLNLYVTDDPEYGFGFTGFKPAQGNTKVAGQVLGACAITGEPRYHQQVLGITS